MMNSGDVLRRWNTVQEIAEYWRVSRRTVARRIRRGQLRATKFGHLVRIRRERVWDYETRCQAGRRSRDPSSRRPHLAKLEPGRT